MKSTYLKKILVSVLMLISLYVSAQKRNLNIDEASDRAWLQVVELLKKEAEYFSNKNGKIRLLQTYYTDFLIEEVTIKEKNHLNTIVIKKRLANRYNIDMEAVQTETTSFITQAMSIKSVIVLYDYLYYFEDFPGLLFIQIEQNKEEFNQTFSMQEKNLETGILETKPTAEKTTDKLIFPIRSKNREKILKAIDGYQSILLKHQLLEDITH